MIDETHDPKLKSWVGSANREGCDFPIQNLPLGVFRAPGESASSVSELQLEISFSIWASGWVARL